MFNTDARWIWITDTETGVNQYACFRHSFTLSRPPREARLCISADSDYQVFINGTEVYGRQFSDYPRHRSADCYEVGHLLRRGLNAIAILAYYRGEDSSEYRKGKAGLIVQLDFDSTRIVSNKTWTCRRSPSFESGPLPRVTLQMGFTAQYDARKEDEWISATYKPGKEWKTAQELSGPTNGYWHCIYPRVLPQMTRGAFHPASNIAHGTFYRPATAVNLVPALAMAADYKNVRRTWPSEQVKPLVFTPPKNPANEGGCLVADLGKESFGLLRIRLEAPEGTVVDISHGEQLEDMGVRSAPGYRRFADRYICRKGMNDFTLPFRRLGCRYFEVHISRFRTPVHVHAVGLWPLEYPVNERSVFKSADMLLDRMHAVSIKTLRLCMGDHYFDCPWREQSLYAYDSRNQALYGYYAFGEYDYPQQSFRLLGWGRRDDGLLDLCAPARNASNTTIPIFSLSWISAVRDHYLFSGRPTLFREFLPTIEGILKSALNRPDTRTGLYNIFDGPGYWSFYEWAPGLTHKEEPLLGPKGKFRIDAPHNLYLMEAMNSYADLLTYDNRLAEVAQWRQQAKQLGVAIQRTFWNPESQRFATYADRNTHWHYSTGVQALAIWNGLVQGSMQSQLQNQLFAETDMVPMTLSIMGYGIQAMRGIPLELQEVLLNFARRIFGRMLFEGSTSLWEVFENKDDAFAEAGSLCHGWSAMPLWLTHAYILGVEPTSPGFRTFAVTPHLCGLPAAEGTVPTPSGPIRVAWEKAQNTCWVNIQSPRNLRLSDVALPGFKGKKHIYLNGRRIQG